MMLNPKINDLQTYPFDRKNKLFAQIGRPISADLTIGEPQHLPDPKVAEILNEHAGRSVARYPRTLQEQFLTDAIIQANSATKKLQGSIQNSQVLAGCGSGELLYSFASACVDPEKPYVLIPNPAYQVYKVAAEIAGGIPYFFNLTKDNDFQPNFAEIPQDILRRTSLCYINNPNNPCAVCYSKETLQQLVQLARQYSFAVASDECYLSIYFNERPLSILEVCSELDGDCSFKNVVAFDSLSKRSSLPGLRSGAMVGDSMLIGSYLRLRLAERKVLPINVQHASSYAWTNLEDVSTNRNLYRGKVAYLADKFASINRQVNLPTGTFYCWLDISDLNSDDEAFALLLAKQTGILTFPGSYFSVKWEDINPGSGFLRIALIDSLEKTAASLSQLAEFITAYRR